MQVSLSIQWTVSGLLIYFIKFAICGDKHFSCGPLYLTVSADTNTYIEVNWDFTCLSIPTQILLYKHNGVSDTKGQVIETIYVNSAKGYQRTKHSFGYNNYFPGNWNRNDIAPILRSHCLQYSVESVRNGLLIDRQCLKIHPTWMERFGNVRIGELMIPGTHNSGTYRGVPIFARNYILNQDRDIWSQLVFGIRYFDFRVGIYGDEFFINHNTIKCTPLLPELQDIANFIQRSPNEIVVVDFYQFKHPKEFNAQHHMKLLGLIWSVLGKNAAIKSDRKHLYGPKLQELWATGKQVIIVYAFPEIVHGTQWLWYQMRRHWGNVQTVEQLYNYITDYTQVKSIGNPLESIMAELTPTTWYIILHPTKSLRHLANMVNPKLSEWLRDNNTKANNLNIIATDFFLGNDVINIAIETNERKLVSRYG